MKKLIFLKNNDSDQVYPIYVIEESKIQEMKMSDTYGNYGQPITPEDAGDYIVLESQKAVETANKSHLKWNEESSDFQLNNMITFYDNCNVVEDVIRECKEGTDYEYVAVMVKGFNYWDGGNWASIITKHPEYNDFQEIEGNELKELQDISFENLEFVKEEFGKQIYRDKEAGYIIVKSRFQSSWADYELFPISEYQL